IKLAPTSYFVVPHQYDEFEKAQKDEFLNISKAGKEQIGAEMHGTVGAVAVDHEGNVAAATSTGGTANCKEGRIGDSSMVGVGSYANNSTCAVSGTGDGEYLIRGVICHSVSEIMRYKNLPLKSACKQVIQVNNKAIKGDIGIIAVDKNGNISLEFNSERMLRAWKEGNKKPVVKIY
ncbi:MAG: asparaginase, partial [Bacteroidetes bacterium]|nr:asparaginase [Bacteroidota bacterium]